MSSHWAVQYIGKPWVKAQAGPEQFDCWGLFRYLQLIRHGVELPAILPESYSLLSISRAFQQSSERDNWEIVQTPQEGDGVLMGHVKNPCHIGYWVDANGGGVLHCIEHMGVVFQKIQNLRETGWGQIQYIRRKK